jgi:hypothetical protein
VKKTLTILVLFLSQISLLKAQNIEDWVKEKGSILYEKVYLHVDRQVYSPGDYIWFKVYHLWGLTHRPMPGYKNVFVQLVSENGKVHAERVVLARHGTIDGDILVTDTIPDGEYTLRAFTRYLENFDEESYYHKKIYISKVKNSLELDFAPKENVHQIDVAFLPEGGNLVLNALNYIAFKAIDETGKGIPVTGSIVDGNDSLVTTFASSYLGMGKFMMMPLEGKTYYARINEFPGFTYKFTDISTGGVALHYTDLGEEAILSVSRNFKNTDSLQTFLVASHKGIVLFYEEVTFSGIADAIRMSKNRFPTGISKITLLDKSFHELAERLIFIEDSINTRLELTINKNEFTSRDKVTLEIDLPQHEVDSTAAVFSLSVVNANYLARDGIQQNLRSYMLIDSELKGYIEAPSAYFDEEDGIPSSGKLDLLMMVHGWRSYYWNDLVERMNENLLGWADAGITIEGYVRALFRNRPVINGEVVLGPFSGNLLYEGTRTDSSGRFNFDRLYLRDNEKIFIHAKNEKDRANTEIILDPVKTFLTKKTDPSSWFLKPQMDISMGFYRENFYRHLKIEEYYPEKGNIMLSRIDIIAKRKERDDGHYRIYAEADKVFTIKDDDYTYTNVLDYLSSRGSGVIVSGDQVSIRGGGMPLILVDGLRALDANMAEDVLQRMPISEIDKIEIITDAANLAAFGSGGGNGVIAVYTRKGDGTYEVNKYVKGRTALQIRGFRKPAQFYSPKYTPANRENPAPDYRPTLLWEPELTFEDNKAHIEFYTSDELADYVVVVEGVGKSGKLYSGIMGFKVNGYFNR